MGIFWTSNENNTESNNNVNNNKIFNKKEKSNSFIYNNLYQNLNKDENIISNERIESTKNIENNIKNNKNKNNNNNELIQEMLSKINLLATETKNTQNIINDLKNNKSKNLSNKFHSNDYFLEEMRHEFIVKKKKQFKNEIKNEIKNKFISPILDLNKKKDEEILKLTLENNTLKSEIKKLKNEIENLNKFIESEKINLRNEINNKIDNIITQNKKDIEILNKNIKKEIEINEKKNNLNFENIKLINNEYNLRFTKQNESIKILKEEIQKIKEENEILTKNDEMKTNELRKLNEIIKINDEMKTNELRKLNEIIKKNDEMKTNELRKLNEILTKNEEMINNELRKLNEIINKNEEIKTNELRKLNEIIKKNEEKKNNELRKLNEIIKKNEKQIEIIYEIKKRTIYILNDSINNINRLKRNLSFNNKDKTSDEKEEEMEDEEDKENEVNNYKLELFSQKNYARVGLINICNTCYMNSVLQILKNIPKFTYNMYISSLDNSDKFIISLKNLLINLCKPNNSPIAPNEFKNYLGLENRLFSGNNQFDSTIFYVALLTIIKKKLNKAKKENIDIDMNKYNNKSVQEQFKLWKENYLLKNQSFIFNLFYIFYVNVMECKYCHNKTYTYQSMNYLDLPIISENIILKNIEECFEKYQMIKYLETYCYKCKKIGCNQNFILLELPPVLMINLKRVGEKKAYLNEIKIPFLLNMKKIIKNVENNSIYELRGFIKHIGDEKSGHNFAFCKNMFDDKWYEYNDSLCRPIDGKPELDKIFFLCYYNIEKAVDNVKYLKKIVDSFK